MFVMIIWMEMLGVVYYLKEKRNVLE